MAVHSGDSGEAKGEWVVTDKLVVHSADGVTEIPLTGEPVHDALLLRFAHRGGTVTSEDGSVLLPDPDDEARRAMRDGA
jgi:hypothetical protein